MNGMVLIDLYIGTEKLPTIQFDSISVFNHLLQTFSDVHKILPLL